jgi:hypothetical protein
MLPVPNPALYVSPEMVIELAMGMDPPLDIAQKYGFSVAEFMALQAQEWFGKMVAEHRLVLHERGITVQTKARVILEEGLQDLAAKSKSTDGLRPDIHMDMLKLAYDVSGLKAEQARNVPQAGSTPGFVINIVVPEGRQGPSIHKIDRGVADKPAPMVIELTPTATDELPPMPKHIKVPDFKLKDDLLGTPLPVGAPR